MTETLARVLIWEHSARAFWWIPTWQDLNGFPKTFRPCALDESSHSIGRVISTSLLQLRFGLGKKVRYVPDSFMLSVSIELVIWMFCTQRLSQDLETGCPKLGILFFKGDHKNASTYMKYKPTHINLYSIHVVSPAHLLALFHFLSFHCVLYLNFSLSILALLFLFCLSQLLGSLNYYCFTFSFALMFYCSLSQLLETLNNCTVSLSILPLMFLCCLS